MTKYTRLVLGSFIVLPIWPIYIFIGIFCNLWMNALLLISWVNTGRYEYNCSVDEQMRNEAKELFIKAVKFPYDFYKRIFNN